MGGGGGGGGLVVAEGELLLICPMQCQHLTNFMQPFKMTASFGSSVLPADSPLSMLTEEQVNANELQTFKGTVGSKSNVFRRQVGLI